MQFQPRFSRSAPRLVALFTGLVLATSLVGAAPANAASKSKKLKYGAIAAGVVSAYLFSKGKTVPAAAVVAGGYYAYKKSGDARDEERNNERFGSDRDRFDRDRYGYNPDRQVYPDDYASSYRGNASVKPRPSRNRGENFDLSPYLR